MDNRTTDYLISLMSPTTLASLIADVHLCDTPAPEAMRVAKKAGAALAAIVGDHDAMQMIYEAYDAGGVPAEQRS